MVPGIALLLSMLASGAVAEEESKSPPAVEKMAYIPGGIFEMGSRRSLRELNPVDLLNTDRHALGPENPAHEVHLDGFYIDIYEVTNADYMEYVQTTGVKPPAFANDLDFSGAKQPVVGVNWKEANQFCEWKGKRLPTEAEWEKASRGKRRIHYPWGNEPPDKTKVNFNEEVNKTTEVGSYEAGKSDYGVYDLSGNVAEWTHDWHYPEYYLFSPKENPPGPEDGQYKVIRGGNWKNSAHDVNMVYRNATVPKLRSKTLGFRCVKSEK